VTAAKNIPKVVQVKNNLKPNKNYELLLVYLTNFVSTYLLT